MGEIRPKLKKLFIQKKEYQKYRQINSIKFYYEKIIIGYSYLWSQKIWMRKKSKIIKFIKNKMEKQYEKKLNLVRGERLSVKNKINEKLLRRKDEKIKQIKLIEGMLKRKLNVREDNIKYLSVNKKELQRELHLFKNRMIR